MKKNVSILMFLTGITSIFGFAKSMTLAFYYGASPLADAYIIGTTVPALFFSFFGHAVKSGFLPIFSDINENKGRKFADEFTNNIIGILTVALILLFIFILIFADPIVNILAPGLDEHTTQITVQFTRITSVSMVLLGLTSIFKAYLNYKNNYSIPAISIIPMDIIILISIVLSAHYNIMFLAYGYLIGALSQTLTLIPYMRKNSFSYKTRFKLNEENTKAFFILIVPILFSVAVNDINKIVDKSLASLVEVGGVSALNYSSKLTGFIQSIIILSISTVVFPAFSKFVSSNDLISLKKSIVESIRLILLLIVPSIVGIIIFAEDVVSLLYGRGEFDEQSITITSEALVFYSIGMLGFGLTSIFTRYFYASKNSKIPMISAIYSALINITLNYVFYYFTDLGIGGLALSTSLATILPSIWLFFHVRKRIGSLITPQDFLLISKILLASLLMASTSILFSYAIKTYSEIPHNLGTIITLIFAVIFYYVYLIILKANLFPSLSKVIFKKIKKNK